MADPKSDLSSTTVRVIDDLKDLDEAFAIRRRVFHEEQKVDPQADVDGLDEECTQLLAYHNGKPAGTCRLWLMSPFIKMQRLAVDSEFRGKGIGYALLDCAASYIRSHHPDLLPVALAQLTAAKLYERAGWTYVDESNVIYEQNMAHKMMMLVPSTRDEVENLLLVKSKDANGPNRKLCQGVLRRLVEMKMLSPE